MIKFAIRKGATKPSVLVDIKHDDNTVYDLTGASSCTFSMYNENGTKVDASSGNITDAPNGQVQYEWSTDDTDTAGNYYGYFTIVLSDASILVVPARNELIVEVVDVVL
jgi:hypothetical protein